MKKLLLAGLAMGALALGAPAAQADHVDYIGGCSFETVNDTTPGGQLGGQNQWNGEATVAVVATDAAGVPNGASISVDCELLINGVSQGVFLSAAGTGVAASGSQFSFSAAATDVVTVCDNVTVDGHSIQNCDDATTTQIVPQPVVDAIDLVFQTIADNTIVVDQLVCPILATIPGVPGVVEFDGGGDLYVLGELFLDCYPYQEEA